MLLFLPRKIYDYAWLFRPPHNPTHAGETPLQLQIPYARLLKEAPDELHRKLVKHADEDCIVVNPQSV